MVRRWAASDRRHQVAVLTALTQLGTEYRSYGSSPSTGFDCSGLTSWAWRQAGVRIPRSSGDQIAAAEPRRRWTAHAGDIVHYPGHVSLYLGMRSAIVHASDPEDDVELAFVSREVRWGDPVG
jgi:cell wall-associated NlpC family hydrolase